MGCVLVIFAQLLQQIDPKDNLTKLFITCLPNSPGQLLRSGRLFPIAVLQGPRLLPSCGLHSLGHKVVHVASAHITLEETQIPREDGKGSSCLPKETNGFGRQQEVSVPGSLRSLNTLTFPPKEMTKKIPSHYGVHVKI